MVRYNHQTSRLLKDFDTTSNLMRDYLMESCGQDLAGTIIQDARQEYEQIIPVVPFIEGMHARALNSFLLITAQEVAAYKAMKKNGKGPSEAWEICHKAIERRMERFPAIKRWFLKRLMRSRFLMRRVRKRVERQEQYKFGEFKIKYLLGDGTEFDWGVDYVACGNYNLAKTLGAEEFAHFVCMSDIALGNALEWGLVRTQTLADGCGSCDFRFKKGSKTRITSKTPEVQATIDRIKKREEIAMDTTGQDFNDIYSEFHEKVNHYLERLVGKNNAEDLTQEVFLKINKGLEDFKGKSSLSTWVYRIATNAALDKLHSRPFRDNKQKISLSYMDDESEAEDKDIRIQEKELSAEREVIRTEMNECIREFVDKLPENYRTVIILSELKDLKNQEIAEILDISLDTVKIRLHRARLKLKEEFETGCNFYHNEDGELACDRKKNPEELE